MTDNEIIKAGDICTYSNFETNKSLSIVEVVKDLSEEVAVVKFHQIIFDDSGNGLFTYLHNTGKTMNVSKKYLRKIDLINRQKAEIERFERENKNAFDKWERLAERTKERYADLYEEAKGVVRAEAVREFAKYLIDVANDNVISVGGLPDLVKQFVEGE